MNCLDTVKKLPTFPNCELLQPNESQLITLYTIKVGTIELTTLNSLSSHIRMFESIVNSTANCVFNTVHFGSKFEIGNSVWGDMLAVHKTGAKNKLMVDSNKKDQSRSVSNSLINVVRIMMVV